MFEFEERFYNADVKKQIGAKAISQLAGFLSCGFARGQTASAPKGSHAEKEAQGGALNTFRKRR